MPLHVVSGGHDMLPLGPWHAVLGWADIITDIMAIIGTWIMVQIASSDAPQRGRPYSSGAYDLGSPGFYTPLMAVQIAFLVGSVITRGIVSVVYACKRGEGRGGVAAAFFPGAVGWGMAKRGFGWGGPQLEAVPHSVEEDLNHKLAEVVWEAPQAVMALVVLASLAILNQSTEGARVVGAAGATVALELVSVCVGVMSMALGALDYIRLHPRSYWALPEPPAVLFLGLVDVGRGTWARSLAMGLFSLFNVISRVSLFTVLFFVAILLWSDVDAHPLAGLLVAAASVFIANLLLLLGMRSWLCLPAALISMFVNVPWVAARSDDPGAYRGRHSCWPAWIMEFVYSGGLFVSAAYGWALSVYLTSGTGREVDLSLVHFVLMGVPIASALLSFVFFVALTGRTSGLRRGALGEQAPAGGEGGAPGWEQVTSLPGPLPYKWSPGGPHPLCLILDDDGGSPGDQAAAAESGAVAK